MVLVPWTPAWRDAFARDAALLTPLAGDALVAVHHVGSTAVEGLTAKPIIDVLLEVTSLHALDARREVFESPRDGVTWLWFGEYGIPRRRYVKRMARQGQEDVWPTGRTHVHAFATGDPEIARHVVFVEALRADDALRDAYAALKLELRERFRDDREAYTDAKTEFIERVLHEHGASARG